MTTEVALQTPVQMPETRIPYRDIAVSNTGGGLMPQNFGDIVAFAEVMSRSQHAIPKHLRNVPGACMAVAMQAIRWQMDPFAVAKKTYLVSDQIAYEAGLFAAVVNTLAPIKRRPDYSFSGEGQTRQCTVSVEMKDGSTKIYESPEIGKITTKNSPLWKSDPDQQLGYFAIRSWARRHTPEVILGVYDPDELADAPAVGPDRARDVTPLAARLAANRPAAEGFNPAHVENETSNEIEASAEAEPVATEDAGPSEAMDAGTGSPAPASEPAEEDASDQLEELLSAARAVATHGRKDFDKWFAQRNEAEREALKPHMQSLMAAAKAAEQGGGK